ncbi:MAG: rRNA maturation RNase YbeY [Pelagibacteraceae bacterium]|jgi:probable rRNA maturation factor|nr:rRNA maturation RNase YbeY [Pelagibacteraceae bacterium]
MIKADVLITNKDWKKFIRSPHIYINKKLKKIDKKIKLFNNNDYNFTLLLSGSLEVKKLNTKFRKKNKTTDILSFPFHEKKPLIKLFKKKRRRIYLGDIAVNLNKIKKKLTNDNFYFSFDKIWIHGLAHLLGHRHKSNLDFSIMNKLETKLLKIIK